MPGPARITRLRTFLLVALIGLVGGLVGLYLFGRAGIARPPQPEKGIGEGVADHDLTMIGQGFEYMLEDKGKPIFHIRGASTKVDREDRVYLEEMSLTLFTDEGAKYEVASRQAVYDPRNKEAVLTGDVHLEGGQGLALSTSELSLGDHGHTLKGEQPVAFQYGDQAKGTAQRLHAELPQDLFQLAGDVAIDSLPAAPQPFSLRAQQVVFERQRQVVRAEGQVELTRGSDRLKAERLNVFLAEGGKGPRFVRALWDVEAEIGLPREGEPANPVRLQAMNLSLLLGPREAAEGAPGAAGADRIELEGVPRHPAVLESPEEGGGVRRISALYISADLSASHLTKAEAFRQVEIRESLPAAAGEAEGAVRRATADRAEAGFDPMGRLAAVTLLDKVTISEPGLTARGDRAYVDVTANKGEIFGAPVEVESDRGDLTAPHLLYTRDLGLLHADGGVRTRLQDSATGALSGTPLGQGEGPIWVQSQEAFLRDKPRSFLFRGQVRAWRGDNLLLAEALRGDEEEDRIAASGKVSTLWKPEAQPPEAKPPESPEAKPPKAPTGKPSPPAGAAGAPQGPVQITADSLTYRRADREAIYAGNVHVVDGGRTLTCSELRTELDQAQKPKTMTGNGNVKIEDPASGRTVTGQRADYDLARRRVEVTGDPVVLRDRDGAQVKGKRLIYDLASGKVDVLAKDPAAGGEPPKPPGR